MSADPRDLATVPDLAAWLGPSPPTAETTAQLQRLLTGVSVWIQSWLSRNIPSQSYTETRDGYGGTRMTLGAFPVTAVSSVVVDGVSIPASSGASIPGWFLANDAVVLRGYRLNVGEANVTVTYTAGFVTVPPDLVQACLELASMRWKERERIGHVSKSIGGETVTFSIKDMPDSVRTILQQYREVVPL